MQRSSPAPRFIPQQGLVPMTTSLRRPSNSMYPISQVPQLQSAPLGGAQQYLWPAEPSDVMSRYLSSSTMPSYKPTASAFKQSRAANEACFEQNEKVMTWSALPAIIPQNRLFNIQTASPEQLPGSFSESNNYVQSISNVQTSPSIGWTSSESSGASFSSFGQSPSIDLSSETWTPPPNAVQSSPLRYRFEAAVPSNDARCAMTNVNQATNPIEYGATFAAYDQYKWLNSDWATALPGPSVHGEQRLSQSQTAGHGQTYVGVQKSRTRIGEGEPVELSLSCGLPEEVHTTAAPRYKPRQDDQDRIVVVRPIQRQCSQLPPDQRKLEDAVLLRGKQAGLPYREIKVLMLQKAGVDMPESTLRGRFRSLSKLKKDRVRKPVWTNRDIQLLRSGVSRDLVRIKKEASHQLSKAQLLAKLSWKKIAEYIVFNGGSYHFGNATCKKKWEEIDN